MQNRRRGNSMMRHWLTAMAVGVCAVPAMAQTPRSDAPAVPAAEAPVAEAPAVPSAAAPAKPAPKAGDAPGNTQDITRGITPNAERVVTIAALDKRTGKSQDFVGKPGQMFDFGALRVRVRTCEITPPWEQKLTGAFMLIDETIGRSQPRRIYSGWMFAESPSLHPLEHARYDIWVKSCTMRFPDTGPATVAAGSVGGGKPAASRAKKSADAPSAAAN